MSGSATVKVVALCGSLRKASFNSGLLRAAMEVSKKEVEGIKIEVVDLSALPMLNTDLEVNGTFPAAVEAFRDKIREADCFFFATPEHNYSVPAVLKNALDWGSRPPNCWGDRAAAIVSAAGGSGGSRAQYHLRQIGVFLDLHFINKPELFLQAYAPPHKFDFATGDLVDEQTKEKLKEVLVNLRNFTRKIEAGKAKP